MEEKYFLNRPDREKLRLLWDDFSKRSAASRESGRDELPQAPDVYVTRTPADGIPANDTVGSGTSADDIPGYGTCKVYQLIDPPGTGTAEDEVPYLMRVSQKTLTVYNVSDEDIAGDIWCIVIRDKYGRWIAVPPVKENGVWVYVTSNTSTGGLWPAQIIDKDANGNRSLGEVVRVKLLPNAGECFVIGDHWVTRNGTSGNYKLYDGVGNDYWIYPICTNNVTTYNKLYTPHATRHVVNVGQYGTGTGSSEG